MGNRSIDIDVGRAVAMPVRDISQERQDELASIPLTPHTRNHWNEPEWSLKKTMVSGSGKYRFNQYGTDGFAYWQYRCKTKDEAIDFLCLQGMRLYRVKEGDPQYDVRVAEW